MTSERMHQLFEQTLLGKYEDEVPWNAVSELRSNGSHETFEVAAQVASEQRTIEEGTGCRDPFTAERVLRRSDGRTEMAVSRRGIPPDSKHAGTRDNPMVLGSGIAALGFLYNSAAIPIIASYTEHSDENVRFSVACALGHFPNDPVAVARLLTLTRDADSDVRDWAVFGLGVQGDLDSPEIRDALFDRMTDSDEDVREEAVVGLGKRRDLRLLPVLRSLLDAPTLKLRVAEAASAMLGFGDDPEEWEADDYKRALEDKFGPPP